MNLIKIKKYEVKESKNGHKIPIINDVHIHSAYMPEREEISFFEKHKKILKEKSALLILGLGYGYHLKKIIKYFEHEKRPFHIAVIEPNNQIIKDCFKLKEIDLKNIKVYCSPSIDDLFQSEDFIQFLLKKPAVIPHAPSFNLYKRYFTKFLTYKSPQDLNNTIKTLHDEETKDYFTFHLKNQKEEVPFDKISSIPFCVQHVKKSASFSKDFDFALIAFWEICQSENKSTSMKLGF
ncbi:MAG: hypothetical protein OXB88_07925 [Bacteriovoracales bacterium]|nr:hypothetical protein [Bacteriovoracales bacterium]